MEALRRDLPGGGVLLYRNPELPELIDALAERDVARSAFFSTEMGRRYWERAQAGDAVDLADLEADAGAAERKAFTRLLSWGVATTLDCVTGLEGVEPAGDRDAWLLRNHKETLTMLRDELFGESK